MRASRTSLIKVAVSGLAFCVIQDVCDIRQIDNLSLESAQNQLEQSSLANLKRNTAVTQLQKCTSNIANRLVQIFTKQSGHRRSNDLDGTNHLKWKKHKYLTFGGNNASFKTGKAGVNQNQVLEVALTKSKPHTYQEASNNGCAIILVAPLRGPPTA